jgi:hypothetical protein
MAEAATTPPTPPLRELLKVQERRAQAYNRLHAGFRKLIGASGEGEGAASAPAAKGAGAGAAGEPAYASLLTELTSEFAALSSRAREIEARLTESGKPDQAALVRRVQEGERDKLRLELSLQRLRRPFAAGAFSWQRATAAGSAAAAGGAREDDAGIGGPLDPAERARGCGCGGGGGHAHQQHDPHDHGGGGGDGGARDQQQQEQQQAEPTEAEWRGAVDEAVRELDAAIGRINEAVEEAMMALEEEE